mgnify:CR=1 FL=1
MDQLSYNTILARELCAKKMEEALAKFQANKLDKLQKKRPPPQGRPFYRRLAIIGQ